jgi:hypothetical protein
MYSPSAGRITIRVPPVWLIIVTLIPTIAAGRTMEYFWVSGYNNNKFLSHHLNNVILFSIG